MIFDYEIVKKMFHIKEEEQFNVVEETNDYILFNLVNYDKDVLYYKLPEKTYIEYGIGKDEYTFLELDNFLHREDGPAIQWINAKVIEILGSMEWWLNGEQLTFDDWCDKTPLPKEEVLAIILKYKCIE